MKVDIERLETCELEMTVEVEPERLEAAKKASARRLAGKRSIPGFRKGKAPYQIILRQFGEEAILEGALDELGPRLYEEALEQNQIDPFAPGALTDVRFDPPAFTFVVPLKPEVDLGGYRSIRLPYAAPEVTDEELNESLEHLREHHAVLEPVERPAQLGDVITVDVKGTVTTDGKDEPLLDDKDVSVLLDAEVTWPVPGFVEKVVGIAAGETLEFDLTFPADFNNEDLRGKTAHLVATCSDVKLRTLPEWDDDFAKEVGSFDTLLDLRAAVRKELQERKERGYANEYARSVQDIAVAGATVKFPPILLDREIKNLEDDLDRRLREQNLNLEDYLKIQKKTHAQLHEDLRPTAVERLKRALVLGKVIDLEGLDLEAGEVEDRIAILSSAFGEKDSQRINRAISSPEGKRSIALDILTDRALERLVAIAKGEAPELPAPESSAGEASQAEGGEAAPPGEEPPPNPEPASLPQGCSVLHFARALVKRAPWPRPESTAERPRPDRGAG